MFKVQRSMWFVKQVIKKNGVRAVIFLFIVRNIPQCPKKKESEQICMSASTCQKSAKNGVKKLGSEHLFFIFFIYIKHY
jgi:hypothetical protein